MTVSLALMIILTITLPFHTRAQTGFLNGFVDLFQDLFSFDDDDAPSSEPPLPPPATLVQEDAFAFDYEDYFPPPLSDSPPPPLPSKPPLPSIISVPPSPPPVPVLPPPPPPPSPPPVSPPPSSPPPAVPMPVPAMEVVPQEREDMQAKPPPPGKKKPPPPPPPASKKKEDSGGVSTTTIIIAVAAGVGGFVALVVVIALWCTCRRSTQVTGDERKMDEENGYGGRVAAVGGQEPRPRTEPQSSNMISHASTPSSGRHAPLPEVPLSRLAPQTMAAGQMQQVVHTSKRGLSTGQGSSATTGSIGPAGPLRSGMPALGAAASTATASGAARTAVASKRSESGGLQPTGITSNSMVTNWVQNKTGFAGQQGATIASPGASGSLGQSVQRSARSSSSQRSQLMDVSAFEIDFSAIRMGKRVGEGSFGKVYQATWNETPVAVKVLIDESNALDQRPELLQAMMQPVLAKLNEEASLMASLRHPNIVQFMGICTVPPSVVTEFCSKGSLADVLRAARQDKPGVAADLSWRRRIGIALDAAKGMLHLHAHRPFIVHRDLKSANILVDTHWRAKIADFNLSRLLEENSGGSSLAAMNPRWLAPEVLTGEPATMSSDVFSFAVVLWELLTWQLPWAKDNPWAIGHSVGNGGRLSIPAKYDLPGGGDSSAFEASGGLDGYIGLIMRCWDQNPYSRPGFAEIIQELRALEPEAPVHDSGSSSAGVGTASQPGIPNTNYTRTHAPSSQYSVGNDALPPSRSDQQQAVELGMDYNEDFDATASMSSTAVLASVDPNNSIVNWGTKAGWGSAGPPPPRQHD